VEASWSRKWQLLPTRLRAYRRSKKSKPQGQGEQHERRRNYSRRFDKAFGVRPRRRARASVHDAKDHARHSEEREQQATENTAVATPCPEASARAGQQFAEDGANGGKAAREHAGDKIAAERGV